MSSSFAAVIFDLDDTLFDHRGAATEAVREWLADMGVAATDELVALWFDAEERYRSLWRTGTLSFAEQRRARLREILDRLGRFVQPDEALDRAFTDYLRRYEHAWRSFNDVRPALDELAASGIRVAILTNGAQDQQIEKVVSLGLRQRIDVMVTCEELGVAKPDPRAYQLTCARLGVSYEHVLHVGDRHDLDVDAAQAAGLAAVHLDRRELGCVAGCARLTSLDGLAEFLAPSQG